MKVVRCDSARHQEDPSEAKCRETTHEWTFEDGGITIRTDNAAPKGSREPLNYKVSLTLSEVAGLIDILAEDIYSAPYDELHELLKDRVGNLQLLIMCGLGYPHPDNIYEEEEDEEI